MPNAGEDVVKLSRLLHHRNGYNISGVPFDNMY